MAGQHFDTESDALAHLLRKGFVAKGFGPYTHTLNRADENGPYSLGAQVVRFPDSQVVMLIIDEIEPQRPYGDGELADAASILRAFR